MILVLVEIEGGSPTEVSLETLAFARSLSQADGDIAIRAVLIGDVADRDAVAAELGRHGASEVLHATGDAFGAYGGASLGRRDAGCSRRHRLDGRDCRRQPPWQRGPGAPGRAARRTDGRERDRTSPSCLPSR